MTDGNLCKRLDVTGKMREIVEVQVMACIHPKPAFMGHGCSPGERSNRGRWILEIRVGIGPGVQFNPIGSDVCRTGDEVGLRPHEKARTDASRSKLMKCGLQ